MWTIIRSAKLTQIYFSSRFDVRELCLPKRWAASDPQAFFRAQLSLQTFFQSRSCLIDPVGLNKKALLDKID
ncbi:MAG: hypothetical protein EAZ60_26600 [Oscillatoriales cyanobacterium]|nr:MAG: hypothetical protein EAZ79_27370 [Oscillatoriales cyanobacterium]TAF26324.1 MAG: hypothetical protein EAZ69_29320 [Oscillatoriales cyanobacterium]TAF51239.1 MAG: hypothetical protein EAZ60_26600 [Oscillatoriales cyanobacterium]